MLPQINLKLRPKILDLKPGTRIVSNSFSMGEWKEDSSTSANGDCTGWCTALLWIIPAKVGGSYKTPQGDVTLKQHFQMLSGTLRAEGKTVPIEGKVLGEEVSFKAGGKEYHGRMKGKQLELR